MNTRTPCLISTTLMPYEAYKVDKVREVLTHDKTKNSLQYETEV